MRAPYRSGDEQRQADCQTCKWAGRQTAKQAAGRPVGHASAQTGRHAATPTGGPLCCRCRAGPSPGWATVCRTSPARQTRSGRASPTREARNRIARWHGRPRGTAPLSGPVPMRATGTAGRNPTAQVGLGRFGRGRAPFHVDARRIEGVGHRLGGTPKRIARKSRNRR